MDDVQFCVIETIVAAVVLFGIVGIIFYIFSKFAGSISRIFFGD